MLGSCLCGAVRYEIDGPFQLMMHCHCSMCRKHHGTAFATFISAPLQGFRWLQGESSIGTYASSERGQRPFCSQCGSVTPQVSAEMQVVICPAGNLEEDPGLRPQAHLFVSSKAAWETLTDDLPQYAEYPPEFGAQGLNRPPIAVQPGAVAGSCLCGRIAYEVHGEPTRMTHCHCSRCRRGRSAAHATNLVYPDSAFAWTRGTEHVREYKVPDARYFAVAFCAHCGSGMPRVSKERGLVIVPAGSLDSDPGVRPQHHIFTGSKAPWFAIADDLPQFVEAPI